GLSTADRRVRKPSQKITETSQNTQEHYGMPQRARDHDGGYLSVSYAVPPARATRGRLWTLSPASGGPGSCGGPAAARLRSALSRAQLAQARSRVREEARRRAQARRSAAEQRTSFRRRQLLRCLVGRAEAALAAAAHVARQRAVRRPGLQPAAAAAGRPRPHPTAKRRWASEAATGESSVGAARAKRACRPEARASGA
ncbi:unnamed protein product, partial [Prorocentrum cordatum]